MESLTFENKRKCFGTREYSSRSGICRACPHFEDCGQSFLERKEAFKEYLYKQEKEKLDNDNQSSS